MALGAAAKKVVHVLSELRAGLREAGAILLV